MAFLTKKSVCGILDKLEHGDSVMADKGFDISYESFVRGTQLNIISPHLLEAVCYLSIKLFVLGR